MSAQSHRADAPRVVRFALLTISDTRTEATDAAGQAAKALIAAAGHELTSYRVLRDEPADVAAYVRSIPDADLVVTCGGTLLPRATPRTKRSRL